MIPREIRWLLKLAGLLLPHSLRADWMREWLAEFWHHSNDRSRAQMRLLALGAFSDSWYVLRHEYGLLPRLGDSRYARSTPVILLAFLLAMVSLLSNGFSRGIALLSSDDATILLSHPMPFMGASGRIPSMQADAWMKSSNTVAELGRWSACRADRVATKLLSESSVLPLCTQPGAFSPWAFTGVVARLKQGATIADANRELQRTSALRAVSLAGLRKASLMPVSSALIVLMLLSVISVRAITVRAWLWSMSRIALCFVLIACVWIESAARAPITETGAIDGASSILLHVVPVLAGSAAAFWLRRDSRHRCRQCFRSLALPVSLGVPGGFLLQPEGTEYLCSAGHGVLLVGPRTPQLGGEVWASWSAASF